ncbi:O-acetylhomoserine aminocarboxypropyltransferase/cysteine synthase [Parabacteroides distasonis]
MTMATKKLHFETLQLHVGQEQPDPATDARAVPIYQTTSYVFHNAQHAADRFGLRDAGNIYGRLTNSTQGVFEARVAALEGGVAGLAVASGAAAVTYALQNIVRAGDHIIAADNLYGGSFNLITHTLASQGITNTIINVNDLNALEAAIRENTKAIYVETFGNPNSDVTNLDAVAEVAHRQHIPLIVDNTFGTPYLIRPIEHGADIVIHSATKFIGGHGSSLGGVIVDGGTFDWKANADKFPTLAKPDPSYHGAIFADVAGSAAFVTRIRAVILRDTGATISPFNAFILLQGLETLSLRVERHVANALKVVDYLSKHPKVEKVNHPSLPTHPDHELYNKYFPNGAGSIFTFEIKGGQEAAWKFIDSLEIFSLLANVADVKSLIIHPYTTTHSQMSPEELAQQHITPSTVRLSIGTEYIDDIIDDLDQAFAKI